MKKLSTQAPLIREAEEKELSALQKNWREYFGAKLAKFDAKSPADLDDEKKKEFFNDLKKDWERGQGAAEAGKKDVETHGVKEGEELNEGRSIEKVSKDITKLASEMAGLVWIWKTAEGKAKTDVLDSLKKKTADKRKLEKELEDLITGKDKDIELIVMEAAQMIDEAEVKNDAEFKEYAEKVLKKAHKDDYDEKKAGKTIEGILKKSNGDYGAAVGMLTSGLS
jgi:hypothetical protein